MYLYKFENMLGIFEGIKCRFTIETSYHTARNRFYNLSARTIQLQNDRKELTRKEQNKGIDILNYWEELDLLLPEWNPEAQKKQSGSIQLNKRLNTIRGQINRANFEGIKYGDFEFFEEKMKTKIEEEFSGALDELEMPLHLYMFERGVPFHTMKHFCVELERYNKENNLAKTPEVEHAMTLLSLLQIPSLRIIKEYMEKNTFNPKDYKKAEQFQLQLRIFLQQCLSKAYEYINNLYDLRFLYYIDKMKKIGHYYDVDSLNTDKLIQLGINQETLHSINKADLAKEVNFFSFVRAIAEEDDIELFYNEADEDVYENTFKAKGDNKNFSVNTFNKIKSLMTDIAKEISKL